MRHPPAPREEQRARNLTKQVRLPSPPGLKQLAGNWTKKVRHLPAPKGGAVGQQLNQAGAPPTTPRGRSSGPETGPNICATHHLSGEEQLAGNWTKQVRHPQPLRGGAVGRQLDQTGAPPTISQGRCNGPATGPNRCATHYPPGEEQWAGNWTKHLPHPPPPGGGAMGRQLDQLGAPPTTLRGGATVHRECPCRCWHKGNPYYNTARETMSYEQQR